MVSFPLARFFHIAQQSRKGRKDQTLKACLKIQFIEKIQLPNHIASSFIFLKQQEKKSTKSHRDFSGISPQKTVSLVSYIQIPLFLDSLKSPSLISYLWNMWDYEKSIILPTWHKKRGISLLALMGMPTEMKVFGLLQLTHWQIWLFSYLTSPFPMKSSKVHLQQSDVLACYTSLWVT